MAKKINWDRNLMSDLQILNIIPSNESISVEIDKTIQITFSENIDPFSINNGISIYTINGVDTDVSILDSEDTNIENTYIINNNTVSIKPGQPFESNKKYFISVFPGNDVLRFISKKTFSDITYERINTSLGTLEISSSFTGSVNGLYTLTFTGPKTFDLNIGLTYIDTYTFIDKTKLNIQDISISCNGNFDIGDVITFDTFKSEGLKALYKTSFITNTYETVLPVSETVDDLIESSIFEYPFTLSDMIPQNKSVNNNVSNPITIKFNKELKINQNLLDKIVVKRTSLLDGRVKTLNYKYKINNNILKIYLVP